MSNSYWDDFYLSNMFKSPSSFGLECLELIKNKYGDRLDMCLLDFGAGDGRDSRLFSGYIRTTALDFSAEALKLISEDVIKIQLDATEPGWQDKINQKYDIIYCRFFLHSIDYLYQKAVLEFILENSNVFFIECRSSRSVPAAYNFGSSHDRFLVDIKDVVCVLEQQNDCCYKLQHSKGLSIYNEEDPYIIRVYGEKLVGG